MKTTTEHNLYLSAKRAYLRKLALAKKLKDPVMIDLYTYAIDSVNKFIAEPITPKGWDFV